MILRFSLTSLFSCFICPLIAATSVSQREFSQKINASLLIRDYRGAEDICQAAEKLFPSSDIIEMLKVKTLAESGETSAALACYKKSEMAKNLVDSFFILESLSWGVLMHNNARAEMSHLSSLVAAYMTQDARAVSLIMKALNSSNAILRIYACKFATQYNDRILQKKILELFKEEKNWYVKKELISTVGRMRLVDAVPYLREILESRSRTHEEKAAAIESLVQIYDDVREGEIDYLLTHKRSGLREFGIALIDHFHRQDYLYKVIPLLQDASPSVRIAAMCYLGTSNLEPLAYTKIEKEVLKLLEDTHPEVAIIAAWLSLKFHEEAGRTYLEKWVQSEDLHAARFGSSVLAAGGRPVKNLLQELYPKVKDPFVKVNLAIGLIKLGVNPREGSKCIKEFLLENKEKIMWQEGPLPMFKGVRPSEVRHVFHISQYPVLIDQLTKLELVNMLSVVGIEDTRDLIREFLKEKMWGIIGSVSVALLEEGDLDAIEVVRELLHDKEDGVKIQAALALAFYGQDSSVVKILEEAYERVDFEKRINILEALGFIGERKSIPFLLKVMEEPFGLLRTIAASSVIQCLYH